MYFGKQRATPTGSVYPVRRWVLIAEALRTTWQALSTWNPAYRKHCFIFSPGDTYHHTMISEPTSQWENMPWRPPWKPGRRTKAILSMTKARQSATAFEYKDRI